MFTLKLVDHYRKEKRFETFTEDFTAYAKGSKYFSEYLAEANLKEDCHHTVIQWGNQAQALNNAQVAFLYSDGLDLEEFKPDTLNNALTPEMCEAKNVHERLKEKLKTWDSANLGDNGEIRLSSSGKRGKDLTDDETALLRQQLQEVQQGDKPSSMERAQGRPDTFSTPYGWQDVPEFKIPTGLNNARAIRDTMKDLHLKLTSQPYVNKPSEAFDVQILGTHIDVMAKTAFDLVRMVESISPVSGVTSEKLCVQVAQLSDELDAFQSFYDNTRAGSEAFYNELFAGLARHPNDVIPNLITLAEGMITTNRANKPK
ncbi:hypothetical protein ValSw41_47 [Vibrio phage ValSw4_1]|nr:hypothetical protein ValSw41_47 [Vibrio phage ValSw4_1]